MLVNVGYYCIRDQVINLEIEHCQNPRLKFLAKNPSWHLNAGRGIRRLKLVILFDFLVRSNALFDFSVRLNAANAQACDTF